MATSRTNNIRTPSTPPAAQQPRPSARAPSTEKPASPDLFTHSPVSAQPGQDSPALAPSPRLAPPPPGFRYALAKGQRGVPVGERKYELVPTKPSGGLLSTLATAKQRLETGEAVQPDAVRRLLSLVQSEGTPKEAVDQLQGLLEQQGERLAPDAKNILSTFLEQGGKRPASGPAAWDPPEGGSEEIAPRSVAEPAGGPQAAAAALQPQAGATEGATAATSTSSPARVDGSAPAKATSAGAVARAGESRFVQGHAWRGGMGAIPHDGGTTFRVWAPNARRVQVIGDFNGWNMWDAKELWKDGAGNWSGFVPDAHHGQRYKYVVEGKYGDWRWKNDPRAADVTNSTGDSVIYDQNAYHWQVWDFQMPSYNEAVIYEMHIGSFHDSPGWGPGNWESAIAKLDDLKWQGINMVKVMPSAEFPGDFSKGYNPAFPFAPESAYGHPDDVKRFVDECHKRGIAVVMDVVFNHWGPNDMPHWDFDGETWGHGGEYFYTDWRAQTPWGATRPDYGRHEVREYIKDMCMMWLRDYRMDGLRMDATSEVRAARGAANPDGWSLMREINEMVNREFPWKIIIAEDMQAEPGITHPWGANFDSQWDREFVHAIRDTVTAPSDSARDMNRVARAISHMYNGNATQRVVFSESHDEASEMNGKKRLPTAIGGWDSGGWYAKKLSTIASALTFTAPGIPMIFQGQEFLEDGQWRDDEPIDWERANHFPGIKDMHRELAQLRRNWYDTTRGLKGNNVNTFHVNNNDKVIGFHRWDQGGPGDDVIVLANMSGRTFKDYRVGLPSDGEWKVRFNSDAKAFSPDFGAESVFNMTGHWGGQDGMPASGTINLPPYSVIILSKDR